MAAIDTTKLRQLLDGPWGGDMPERSALRQLLAAYDEQGERLERAVSLIEKLPCECYDEPTLAPTDNPRVVECERCSFLASGVST